MGKGAEPIGRGYIQIYTGNGKGKTTAALGIALRASGYGLTTCIVQFMKVKYVGGGDEELRKDLVL